MPITTTVVVKSFAALLATGLGTLGGFNYVSGGNVWGTGNDYPTLPSPTSISSVAGSYAAPEAMAEPVAEPTVETVTESANAESLETESTEQDATEADGSCCTSTGRAGFLTGTEMPAPADEPIADATDDDEG